MKTIPEMRKLLRTAAAILILALVPGFADAETAATEQAGDTLKLTLGPIPGTILDTTEAARGAAGRAELGSFWLGGTVGPQFGSDFTAFRVTAEMQATLAELAPNVYLDLAGHVGGIFGSGLSILEFIPAARFRFLLPEPRVSLYFDLGMGPAFAFFSGPTFFVPFVGFVSGSTTEVWGNFRMAGGLQFRVTPAVALLFEPVGLNVYFGTGSEFMYSLAFGVLFRV